MKTIGIISIKKHFCKGLSAIAVSGMVCGLLALPINWNGFGKTAALIAAGIQHPDSAAMTLSRHFETKADEPQTALMQANTYEKPPASNEPLGEMPVAAVSPAIIPTPAEDGSGGKIFEQKLDVGDRLQTGVAVRNRSGTAVDIGTALQTVLTQKFAKTAEPQVLIIHTHTTEGYMRYDAGYYNAGDRDRTTDQSRSVCAVGEAVVQALAQQGIAAVHDTAVHDSPQYTGAYTRSAETVERNLKQYPSIKVVLDLHRDAIMNGDTGLVKPTVTVNGKKAAQMMMIVGVVSTTALPNPYWEQNLALAAQWQKRLTETCGDIMRPLSTVASRYNQYLCPGYLLVEVGSEGNTVEEAVYSGTLLGKTLADVLGRG